MIRAFALDVAAMATSLSGIALAKGLINQDRPRALMMREHGYKMPSAAEGTAAIIVCVSAFLVSFATSAGAFGLWAIAAIPISFILSVLLGYIFLPTVRLGFRFSLWLRTVLAVVGCGVLAWPSLQ